MQRTELTATLEFVGQAIAPSGLVPIFGCYCFKGGQVYAFNDNLGIMADCEVKDTFAVHGPTLLGLLQHGGGDEVDLKLNGKDLLVKSGKSVMKLPYMTEDDFIFEPPSLNAIQQPLGENFLLGLETCLPTASRDQSQPGLLGITLSGPYLYACDGDALTRYEVATAKLQAPMLLPLHFCEAVIKAPRNRLNRLMFNKEWVLADCNTVKLYGRYPDNPNPLDFEGLIKSSLGDNFGKIYYESIPDGLTGALNRARVVADPVSAKTVLTVSEGKLTLHTDTSLGEVTDVMPFDHPDIQANISAALVHRATTICDDMAILHNCTAFRAGATVFQLVSNMG